MVGTESWDPTLTTVEEMSHERNTMVLLVLSLVINCLEVVQDHKQVHL